MLSYSNPSLNRLTFMLPISYNCLDKAMVHFGASFHINIFYITVSYDHILEMFFPGFLFWFFLQSLLTYFFCPIQRDVFLKISFLAVYFSFMCLLFKSMFSEIMYMQMTPQTQISNLESSLVNSTSNKFIWLSFSNNYILPS